MKLMDKLKNVFFEEVPEDEDDEELPQTFAKKIEVPKKPVEVKRVEPEMKREERIERHVEFDEPEEEEEVEIKPQMEEVSVPEEKEEQTFPMMFDDDDFLEDKKQKELDNTFSTSTTYKNEEPEKELYQGKKELSYIESVRRPNYSYTKSYYEEKETKGFRPSPIISPVYGVLDKNYRKEEVVTKKEVKVSVGKKNFDLDSVRNKAFGRDDEEISDKKTREAKAREEEQEEKKIYDVNNNKPQVNKVTLADADEYYNDLGLAYNVDYSDASRSNHNNTRSSKYNIKNNKKKEEKDVDDNLFDLIDSMYSKED